MARPKLSGEGALAAPTEVSRRQNAGSYWFTDTNCGSCDEPLWLAGGEYFRNFVVLMRTATNGELSSALVTRTTVPPQNQHLRSKLWLAGRAISMFNVSPGRGMSSGPSEGSQRIRIPLRLMFSTIFIVLDERLLPGDTRHSSARLILSCERCSSPCKSSRYRAATLLADEYMNPPLLITVSYSRPLFLNAYQVSRLVISKSSSKANKRLSAWKREPGSAGYTKSWRQHVSNAAAGRPRAESNGVRGNELIAAGTLVTVCHRAGGFSPGARRSRKCAIYLGISDALCPPVAWPFAALARE